MISRRRRDLAIAAALAVIVATLALVGWPGSEYRDGDFAQYWLAARAALAGVDPYDPATWRALHEAIGSAGGEVIPGYGFFYPMTTAAAALPVALLPLPLAAALWFVSAIAAAAVVIAAILRRVCPAARGRDAALVLALAALMQPGYVIGDGNVTRHLTGAVGGAILLAAGHPFAAGALLGIGALKPQLFLLAGPAFVLFAPAAARARLVSGAVVTVGLLLAASLAIAPSWIPRWIDEAARLRGAYGVTNVWSLFPGPVAATLVGLGIVALLVWWRRARPPFALACGAALALSVLAAPYAVPYDTAMLLVGVAAVVGTIAPLPRPTRAIVSVALVATSPVLQWLPAAGVVPPGIEMYVPAPALYAISIAAGILRARAAPSGAAARAT